jgi:hypothetical protein
MKALETFELRATASFQNDSQVQIASNKTNQQPNKG